MLSESLTFVFIHGCRYAFVVVLILKHSLVSVNCGWVLTAEAEVSKLLL